MTRTTLSELRTVLQSRATELTRTVRNRTPLQVEHSADLLDQVLLRSERELAASRMLRDSTLLREVNEALARMDAGSYGICQQCEEPISAKRLAAIPWTAYCLACQTRLDEEDDPLSDSGGSAYPTAA